MSFPALVELAWKDQFNIVSVTNEVGCAMTAVRSTGFLRTSQGEYDSVLGRNEQSRHRYHDMRSISRARWFRSLSVVRIGTEKFSFPFSLLCNAVSSSPEPRPRKCHDRHSFLQKKHKRSGAADDAAGHTSDPLIGSATERWCCGASRSSCGQRWCGCSGDPC